MKHLLTALFVTFISLASIAQDTLWINTGSWYQSYDTLQVMRLNSTPQFDTSNVAISLDLGQTLPLVIINNDSENHVFNIEGLDGFNTELVAGEATEIELPSLEFGTYRYYASDERADIMGLAGVIKSGIETDIQFHWNLDEWMPSMVDSVSTGAPIDEDVDYLPKYFSINSRTFPNTENDPNAHISLNLGDTCTISIANSGMMDHVFHFHGFHILWLSSTQQTERVGWDKDTVPMKKGEALTLQLVANQLGMYPVHNHNLIAVTNAGFYPGGMITMINVMP